VGDLNHQSFAEIWNHGEKVKQFRHWHLAGQFYFLPECAHCGNYDVSSIPDVELQSLLAETDQSTMADWRGWRQDNPETFTKRINSFVKVRPERMDELEKAIKRFSDLGMVKEAEQTQTIWKNNFSKYLRGLAEKGDQQKAEQVLIQQFEKLLNVHFDEVIALFRQENCEVESLLQLYKIDPLQFVKEQIPGLEEDFYLLTQWQLVHQKLIAKYALQRDIGNYYWHQQSYETAIFWFKRRLETASDDIACLKQLAFSHYHLGERAEAQMIAQKALSLREDFEMQRLLGHICLEESRFRDAKSAFLVAQKLEPRDWLSNFGLLQAQQATAKDLDRNLFLHLLEIAPDPQSRQEVHSLIDKKKDE
jgi:tetratricopeptide (TPR) repeat protein